MNTRKSFFLIGLRSLLGARLSGGGVSYYDDATRRRWWVARKDVTALGRMAASKTPDAYSIWCSQTSARELSR